MWNGIMFVDLDWPLNASSLLSASAELLVVSYDILRRYPIPSAGALKTPGWEKLAIFDGNLRLSRKRCDRAR